jgi:hypothetical protein
MMDVPHGIGLFVLGMIVTVCFFVLFTKAMENEKKSLDDKTDDN